MATLDALRAKLNGEIGVATDGDTKPWTSTIRNTAISDGYADLWRKGVWKLATQSIATVDEDVTYALTTIRRLDRVDLLDSESRVVEQPRAVVEEDGAGGYQLRLRTPIAAGFTLLVRGWTAYKSQFSGGSDTDDLPAEDNRIPLLKAKVILYRIAVGNFARYGERQALPPDMNSSVENLLAVIAAAEREYADEARALSRLRPRTSQTRSV